MDDVQIAIETQLEAYNWNFVNGVLEFENLEILEGGEIITNGKGDKVYVNKSTDVVSYFGVIGKLANGLKVILPKCKAVQVNQSYQNKNFALVTSNGKAIRRNSDNKLRLLVVSESAPVVSDFHIDTATI